MFHQDWEPVVIRTKKEAKVQSPPPPSQIPKKLDQNLEGFDHKKVPKQIADAIQRRRIELKLTQTELANKINEKPVIVNDVENCRGVYNHIHINKILKALGLTLKQIKVSHNN
jgi:putative transcription factor